MRTQTEENEFKLGKQLQWCLGNESPAIRYSPDEESGATAAVGFKIVRFT